MSFGSSTFNFFSDSGLTVPFSGTLGVINRTDLSDNPQDFIYYLGSNTSGRELQALSNPGVDEIVLTPTDILPEWVTITTYVLGKKVQPVSGNGFVYQCTTAGTTDVSEPTWPVVGIGSTITDGSVIWTLCSAHHPYTEIKLALSSGGLSTATPGAPLNLGNTILGSVADALPIYIRITNTVTNVANNTGNEELSLFINECVETTVP